MSGRLQDQLHSAEGLQKIKSSGSQAAVFPPSGPQRRVFRSVGRRRKSAKLSLPLNSWPSFRTIPIEMVGRNPVPLVGRRHLEKMNEAANERRTGRDSVSVCGLDTKPDQVREFLKDPRLLDLWDRMTVGRRGSDGESNNKAGHNQHTKEKTPEIAVNRDNVTVNRREPNRGNTQQYAIRRLRNEAPDFHEKVMTGELSAHAAMVQAGPCA